MSTSAGSDAATDGLPEYLQRLIDAAVDLPLRHRMPRPTATARRSAVLILFGEGPEGPDVLLIEKSAHLRRHAGQPAFPGGGADPGDDYPDFSERLGRAIQGGEADRGVLICGSGVGASIAATKMRGVRSAVCHDTYSARQARVPLAELADPANRYRLRHPSGYVGAAFCVADMEVWGFTAGLLDAILEAAGLARPWDTAYVRSLPASAIRPYALPGSVTETGEEDDAAPEVADPPPDGPPTRTVPRG